MSRLFALVYLADGRTALAQMLPALFPDGVPGVDATQGVTVGSRVHPELAPQGVRDGAIQAFPSLDETIGYDSNPLPGSARRGSWELTTAPLVTFGSDWTRDQIGGVLTLQDTRYLGLATQDRIDYSLSAGVRIDFGNDQLTISAAHSAQHEDRGEIDTLFTDRPVAYQVDDLRVAYAIMAGRWTLTPTLDIASWTYDRTTILGVPASQSYRDRLVGLGELTVRYQLAPLRNLLFVLRSYDQQYSDIPAGQPTTNSHSYQLLTGFDYDDNTVWRWRLLLGGEAKEFAAPVYRPQDTLIAEAEAIWSPSAMTTLRATFSRDTQDAAQEGVSGLVYSSARLTIDHEYLRNLLLKASAGLQQADYFQNGRQTGFTAGLGATWTASRSMRLSFSFEETDMQGGSSGATSLTGQNLPTGFSRSLTLLTMHFAL